MSGVGLKRRNSRNAFTLVELLVVIAILAVLAALLFPVFSRERRKALQTTCVSNQRQIGAALMLYLQDFDETYPNFRFEPLGSPSAGDFEKNSWRVVISPYLRSPSVMLCPTNPDNSTVSDDGKYSISYAANYALNPRDYPLPLRPPLSLNATGSGVFGSEASEGVKAAAIVKSAECIAVVEMIHVPYSAFTVDVATNDASRADNIQCFADCLFTGHSGLTNYLFSDGHVKALKPTATYHGNETNYWYRDATPLGSEARTTLTIAQAHDD